LPNSAVIPRKGAAIPRKGAVMMTTIALTIRLTFACRMHYADAHVGAVADEAACRSA
jgi:hypothetical protein